MPELDSMADDSVIMALDDGDEADELELEVLELEVAALSVLPQAPSRTRPAAVAARRIPRLLDIGVAFRCDEGTLARTSWWEPGWEGTAGGGAGRCAGYSTVKAVES
jgi:hypothetical protein